MAFMAAAAAGKVLLYDFTAPRSNRGPQAAARRERGQFQRQTMEDIAEISRQLIELRIEHRDLDSAIARIVIDPRCDELQLKRMKKRKLRLKDMITYLENKLIPDLDA
jgi:hypothetical protein